MSFLLTFSINGIYFNLQQGRIKAVKTLCNAL
uniref:ClassII CCA-adding enzyme-like protein n=1 Tax=Phage sp. ctIHi3 TaxID=2825791 RepID=A0A8S5Q6J1_9VIRU|nr:MAG TPA: ClassII CCA-adding enzyme-like protein [Phage sp. ctIHi3]